MKSIRTKLFFIFSVLLIFFISFSIFMNTYFLEDYYIYRNESTFLDSFNELEEQYKKNPNRLHEIIKYIDRSSGIHIVILSPDMKVKEDSFPFPEDKNKIKKFSKSVIDEIEKNKDRLDNDYIYSVKIDSRFDTKNLQMISKLSDDNYALFSKPLGVIGESASIANDFFLFVGVITVLLANLIIFIFSKRMVHPIREISEVAKDISNLKFEKKYVSKSKDEIDILGDSINQISDKLDSTIKELVLANDNLKEDIEEKKAIDNMRKTFITNVSHELKTPIAIIKGYVEGLKYGVVDAEIKKEEYLDIIVDEAEKMDVLVKNLLDLSTIESKIELDDKNIFNISVLIDDIIDKYKAIFKENIITYRINCEDDYFVKANMFRIEQVLVNYINNAINHVDGEKCIDIVALIKQNFIRVSVFNTGKNIAKEELESIWTSFYKIDKSRSREYGGTGLGLSIVKSIIDDHGGNYGVINRYNGVEFWFELSIIDGDDQLTNK